MWNTASWSAGSAALQLREMSSAASKDHGHEIKYAFKLSGNTLPALSGPATLGGGS
jgi:hypothetical protein